MKPRSESNWHERKRDKLFFATVFLILLIAVLAKTYALFFDPFLFLRTGITSSGLICVIFSECLIAILMISKAPYLWKIVSAGSLFLVMFVWSLFGSNETECFCFGGFLYSQTISFVINSLVLVFCLWVAISFIHTNGISRSIQDAAMPMFFLLGVAVPVFVFLAISESVATDNPYVIVHLRPFDITYQECVEIEFEIESHYLVPVKIVAIQSTCSCVIPEETLKTVLSPESRLRTSVMIRPKKAGIFSETVFYMLDSHPPNRFRVDISGLFN